MQLIKAYRPMFICDDVPAMIAYYQEILGFQIIHRIDDIGKSGWASMGCGGVEIMFASPTYMPEGVKVDGKFPQCVHYFYTTDAEALRKRVTEAGYEASELKVTFYNNKEFETVDPAGNMLTFGQPLDD